MFKDYSVCVGSFQMDNMTKIKPVEEHHNRNRGFSSALKDSNVGVIQCNKSDVHRNATKNNNLPHHHAGFSPSSYSSKAHNGLFS